MIFAQLATKVRHSSPLQNADWLWNLLRKPYHYLLNIGEKGVPVKVNDSFSYRIPPQYYYVGLEDYETITIAHLVSWIKANPNCYVLDIGCSLGYMSAISLFASPNAKVLGFDSDLSSLKATLNMCGYAPSKHINVVYGLISEASGSKVNIEHAIKNTAEVLAASNVTGAPGTTNYANLDTADKSTPYYTLDDLLETEAITQPVLIKCDIEGAELFALKGAKKFITKYRPTLLLSVHPYILPVFNCSVEQVTAFLKEVNYTTKIIAIDHEEHWWCQPI